MLKEVGEKSVESRGSIEGGRPRRARENSKNRERGGGDDDRRRGGGGDDRRRGGGSDLGFWFGENIEGREKEKKINQ